LISREPFFVREGGAYYGAASDRRWLTAASDADLKYAVEVARRAGSVSIGVVEVDRRGMPAAPAVEGFRVTGTSRVRFFSDTSLRLTSYRAS
jgi:hypothetical protein